MNTFINGIKEEMSHTFTENGAKARNTSGDYCLDFFSTAGSLRQSDESWKQRLFLDAFQEDPLSALRILFYVRDVRGGLGERDTFRTILKKAAEKYPEHIKKNIWAIPFYGRYDDLFELIGTPCESSVWSFLKDQVKADIEDMENGRPVSLMAKWVKRGDESSKSAHALGIMTANRLGYSVSEWKRIVAKLRKYIDVVEVKMSTKQWDKINYSTVPSRASMIYRDAFRRHDSARYAEFLLNVESGKEKINASTLYPYDIVEKVYNNCRCSCSEDKSLQLLWDSLPDYVEGNFNALVIADTSGSMLCGNGRPFYSAISLAIYFAQRNHGEFHNYWMTFSEHPSYQKIRGNSLQEIVNNMDVSGWSMNTNLEAALRLVLQTAVENHVPQEDVPKSLIIISDMEIDECEHSGWSFYDHMKSVYIEAGYEIPNIVFWNVNSRHDVFHADKSRRGVQLVSGQSPATFKNLMNSIGMTPIEYMLSVINSERYQEIQLAD